jgi:hypothetical protein
LISTVNRDLQIRGEADLCELHFFTCTLHATIFLITRQKDADFALELGANNETFDIYVNVNRIESKAKVTFESLKVSG